MRVALILALLWMHEAAAAAAETAVAPAIAPAAACRAAIAAAEADTHIPDAFLSAIGRVESGRRIAGMGLSPWPWTINAAGTGHFYTSKLDAVAAARTFLSAGVKSIDVGCLQVSLLYHPEAFVSLDDAFDPGHNASFAARFLLSLFQRERSWPRAAAAYHSQTPMLGQDYQQKVLAAWAVPDGVDPAETAPALPESAAPTGEQLQQAGHSDGPAPVAGFNRSLRLPGAPVALPNGRLLASYRAFPVVLAHGVTANFRVRQGPTIK
jgi:hypothetical protein